MLKFLERKPIVARTPDDMIQWVQFKLRAGTTALVPYDRKARPGWKITHNTHGRVKLLGRVGEKQLKVELLDPDRPSEQIIVDAADCGEPIFAAAKITSTVEETTHEWIRDVWMRRVVDNAFARATGAEPCRSTAAGKRPLAPEEETELPPPSQKPKAGRGRPKGSKDKAPRVRSRPSLSITWDYAGKCGPPGQQFVTIGESVVLHDSIPSAGIIVQQPTPSSLVIQLGEGDDAALMTVDARLVQAEASSRRRISGQPDSTSGASGTGSGEASSSTAPKQRNRGPSGSRAGPSQAVQVQPVAFPKAVTKAVSEEAQKRRKREETAAARGRPLKAAREQKNRKWEDAYKQQAVTVYKEKFSAGSGDNWAGCRDELRKLSGFEGVQSAHIRAWVLVEVGAAAQEPNELGLIVAKAGRPPALPDAMYKELVEHIKKLAKVKAFTMNSTSMQPIALAFIVSKLGPLSVWCRPGHGGFEAGYKWMRGVAHNAELKWRKPFGDARKNPPNAKDLIQDMVLRLAYLMHEFDIPPCLVLNFDHTGLHFMQMRGNTWTVVEEDTETAHQSRPNKGKEVKQQNKGDKRQATGTVGSSMAGDILPGQLIVEGEPTSVRALPSITGTKYVNATGSNPGHKTGVRMAFIPTATLDQEAVDMAKLVSMWIGHFAQTTNHWANIRTSYAILEFIIVPWLLEKKRAIGKPWDAKCVLIVDCWYGWKDQDKKKTLNTFRHYVRDHYPWLRLLFVPAACTDLAQPADRGFISWLKGNMRSFYTDTIAKAVLQQLDSVTLSEININTSAPYLKQMLTKSYARALSQLPREKVIHCWAPLQEAWDKKEELHGQAKAQLSRLFPNNAVDTGPEHSEPDPDPIITAEGGDDFEPTNESEADAESGAVHARFAAIAAA